MNSPKENCHIDLKDVINDVLRRVQTVSERAGNCTVVVYQLSFLEQVEETAEDVPIDKMVLYGQKDAILIVISNCGQFYRPLI